MNLSKLKIRSVTLRNVMMAVIALTLTAATLTSCSKNDDSPAPGNPGNPGTPGNPTPKFDAKNLVITVIKTDYKPGDKDIYVDYHVENKSKTQSYDINDGEWDILFKIKATDGYEYSNYVNVLSIEAESDYIHGLPIYVSSGKTLDLGTLTFEVVPDMD